MLCRSAQHREKENAMLSKAEARFLKDVAALRERIAQGRLKDPATIERKIGRLQKKHPRVTRFYALAHENGTLSASRHEDKRHQAGDLCGDYVLKTDQCLSAAQNWSLYMTLPDPEQALVYKHLRIDWKSAFPQIKTFAKV